MEKAPASTAPPAEKVARAPAAVFRDKCPPGISKKQTRKYIALCMREGVLLQAVVKDTARPGFKLIEAVPVVPFRMF